MKLPFLGFGSVEGPNTKNFGEQLPKAGIQNLNFESSGTAHEWSDVAPVPVRLRPAHLQIGRKPFRTVNVSAESPPTAS